MIVIEKGTTRTPSNLFRVEPSFLGNISKSSIAIVTVENIMPPIGHKKIVEPIVVVIPYAYTLPPAGPNEPRLFCYITKGAIVIVSQQPVCRSGRSPSLKGLTVDQKNILPSIIVVIKKAAPQPVVSRMYLFSVRPPKTVGIVRPA